MAGAPVRRLRVGLGQRRQGARPADSPLGLKALRRTEGFPWDRRTSGLSPKRRTAAGASIGVPDKGARLMRRLALFVPIAIVVVSALPSGAGAIRNGVVIGPPRVELQPAVVGLRERATIAVSGIHARSLEVLLAGATGTPGNQLASQLPWLSLQLVDGAWRGTLPAPALRGVYRVMLRTGATRIRSPQSF